MGSTVSTCIGLTLLPRRVVLTVDDTGHTLFCYQSWEDRRTRIAAILGRPVGPDDVEELLCGGGVFVTH